MALCLLFAMASHAVDAPAFADAAAGGPRTARSDRPASMAARFSGLHRSHRVVVRLSALFALDSFGGGFVVQSFVAYWFYLRFGVEPKTLGTLFFGVRTEGGALAFSQGFLRYE